MNPAVKFSEDIVLPSDLKANPSEVAHRMDETSGSVSFMCCGCWVTMIPGLSQLEVLSEKRGDAAELLDFSGAPFALYSYDAYGNPGQVLTAATARMPAALAGAIAEANVLRYAGCAYGAHSGSALPLEALLRPHNRRVPRQGPRQGGRRGERVPVLRRRPGWEGRPERGGVVEGSLPGAEVLRCASRRMGC